MKYVKMIKKYLTACFILLVVLHARCTVADELPMVLVIPSYNNEKWLEKNLHSALHQNYSNYRILYVDDHSTDSTKISVEQYLKDLNIDYIVLDFEDTIPDINITTRAFSELVNQEQHFFTLIHNKKRSGALANLYRMIHSCHDQEIIVSLDGDDWLAHDNVLKMLDEIYQSKEIWFTHGTLKEYPWGHVAWSEPIPEDIIQKNGYRERKCPSHLRTFYTWLFKKIQLEDFLYEGEFIAMAWDMAIMFPLAEMAAERHAFIKDILYIYNMSNPINDNRVDAKLQNDLDAWIRNKPRYLRLDHS